MFWIPLIAQAEIAGMEDWSALHEQLLAESTFIATLYGGVFLVGFILLALFTLRIQKKPLSWEWPLALLERRPWNIKAVLKIILPLLLVQAVLGALVMLEDTPGDEMSGLDGQHALMLQGALFHGLCFLLILLAMRRYGIGWLDGFGVSASGVLRNLGWGGLIFLGIMPIVMSSNLAAQLVMNFFGIEPRAQEVARVIASAGGWMSKSYFVFLAVVAAPVVEEMLFRGILLPAISRVAGIRAALILTGLIFSLVHGFYMPALFVFFILSVSFSLAYIYRGSLLVPVAMHALFNGLTMVVLLRL